MRIVAFTTILLGLPALAAAQDAGVALPSAPVSAVASAPTPGQPLARTQNAVLVTAGDVARAINARPAPMRGQYVAPSAVDHAARTLLRERLLADEARRTHVDDETDVRAEVDRVLAEAVLQRAIAGQTPTPVSDAEVEAYYNAHILDMFTEPEKIRPLVIMVRTEALARRLIAQLRRANERRFRATARRVSEGRSASDGGDVGWLSAGGAQDPALIAEAFRLREPGRMSEAPVAAADNIFYIVRIAERQDPVPMSLDGLRRTIRSRIEGERRTALEDALLQRLMRERGVRVVPAAPHVRVVPTAP